MYPHGGYPGYPPPQNGYQPPFPPPGGVVSSPYAGFPGMPPPTLPQQAGPGGYPSPGMPPPGFRPDFSRPPPGFMGGPPPPTLPVSVPFPPPQHHFPPPAGPGGSPMARPPNTSLPQRFPGSGSNASPLPPRPTAAAAAPIFRPGGPNASGPPPRSSGPGGSGPGGQLSAQTTLFVGSISPGITDQVLEQLLNTCGSLRVLKRVRDAAGKPKAFGFAEYEDPDSVLRALAVLNGVQLPDLETKGNPGKKLVVNVEAKTREFLDEYEQAMDRTTEDDQLELSAVKSITAILEALNTGRPLPATSTTSLSVLSQDPSARPPVSKEAAEAYLVPAHLRDLKDEELPEENREVVLDQIALFRQQAVQRELEKKRNEEEAERRRLAAQAEQARLRVAGGALSSRQQESFSDTPQTYNRPVGFVAASSSSSSAGPPERTDEEEELIRVERRRRDALDAVRERERRNDARERTRLVNVDRDLTSMRAREQEDEKEHFIARDRLALWDDDEVADRGRDLWFIDRPRWRAQRQLVRRREEDADAADAVAEAAEREAARVAAEERAKEEAREQALLAEKQKAAGILTDETAPIKLTVAPLLHEGGVSGYAGAKKKDVKPAAGAGVKFVADDDEEEDAKKKRVLVKLDYGEGLTPPEREAKRLELLSRMRREVPSDQVALFAAPIQWEGINETVTKNKLEPLVRSLLIKYVGEDDADFVELALGSVRERKSASELVEAVEMVLEDDAPAFATALWRQVLFESLAADEGVDTREATVER